MSDPYAGLPQAYLDLLHEKKQEETTAKPPPVADSSSREPTPEEEEEMDRYYQRESWLESGSPKRGEKWAQQWYPPAIGDGL